MSGLSEQQVLAALRQITDPDRGKDIVSLGMISGVQLREGHVGFAIEVDPQRGPKLEPLRKAAEKAVEALPGVLSVTAVLTAQKPGGAATGPRPAPPQGHAHAHGAPGRPHVPRLPARRRARGHAQLHRGGRRQQLRGAHRRVDCVEL